MSERDPKLASRPSSQRPVVKEDPQLTNARNSANFGFKRWLLVVGVATALHEPTYHQPLKTGFENLVVNPYKKWQAERALAEAEEEMSKKAKDALDADKKKVEDRNKTPLERIKAREVEAKAFKAKLYTDYESIPYRDIYFPVEYYSQGTADNEKEAAGVFLEMVVDKTHTADKDPDQADFQKLVSAVMPTGSYERTKSSATLSLCEKLGPESQNCVARTRLIIMAVAQKYPHLQKSLFIQKFGDHERALVEVGGVRHILEGNVPRFPDGETSAKKNEVMPVEVWLALYSGHKRSEFEDRIERHGPQSKDRQKPADYPRVTDQLVAEDFWDKDLDNVGTAEGWFNSSNGVMGGTEGTNGQNNEDMDGGMSVEGQEPKDTAKKIENLLGTAEEMEQNVSKINEQRPNDTKVYDFDSLNEQDAFKLNRDAHQERLRKISFPHLKKIDAEAVKMLIRQNTDGNNIFMLRFEALTDLDEAAAIELAKFSGQIYFGGFQSLPVHVMKAFSGFGHELTFKAKIASKEALEAFVGKKPGVKMTEFFDIDTLLPEDADSNFDVSKDSGNESAPRRYVGGFRLEDTIGLSTDAAEVLSRYRGNLSFTRVGLSRAAAEKLAKIGDSAIQIDDPTFESLEGFNEHTGNIILHFKNVHDDDLLKAAKGLVLHKGEVIVSFFSGKPVPTSLSVDAAKVWGSRKGNLSLNGSMTMSDEALGELASINGSLRVAVNPRATLSVEAAKKFAQFGGDQRSHTLRLEHISHMSGEAASYLIQSKAREIYLPGFSTITPELARYFAQFPGGLYLPNVKSLSVEAARELGKHTGTLDLGGFSDVPIEVFRELIKNKGQTMIGVKLVTVEMARALTQATHTQSLWSAKIRSKKAAVILHELNKKYPGRIHIEDIAMQRVNAPFRPEIKWEEE
ncbi:hypothetical protein IT413_06605 [Candidatus Peregrinibacteria bacterium]|nr:hypothetical protein [Candidatus Peregrinibacteria bacterium]